MHARLVVRAASELAASLLIATGAVSAQEIEPAVIRYATALTGPFADPPGPPPGVGKGFLFEPAAPIAVTGLSVFRPSVLPVVSPPAATTYTVALYSMAPAGRDAYTGTLLASAVVGPGSATRDVTGGPPGTFLTTALPGALALTVGSLYGVFAAPLDGWIPHYAAGGVLAPLTAPEIVWRGDASALLATGEALRNDAHSDTGGSFEFSAVPEPSTLMLATIGLVGPGGVAAARRSRVVLTRRSDPASARLLAGRGPPAPRSTPGTSPPTRTRTR